MGYYNNFYPGYYFAGVSTAWSFISLAIAALSIVAMWKIFVKAGEEGWAAVVPFYNLYILFKITWGNGLMFLLLLIPIANIVFMIMTWVKLAKAFGKGGGWACGLVFLNTIFLCITGFSNDITYMGVPGKDGFQPGAYSAGNYQNPYQNRSGDSYQDNYRQYQSGGQNNSYQQQSAQNPEYHYQRSDSQTSSGANFCPACGASMEPGAKFCVKCGKQL